VSALAILASVANGTPIATSVEAAIALIAVLSIIVGSVTALRQTSYTRMLGYAGVAQVGYALVAVATTGNIAFSLFFIASYAIASAGTFLAANAFSDVRSDWDGSIEGLAGIGRQAPVLGVATCMLVISLAGIPPLLGFWSKFAVFWSAASGGLVAARLGHPLPAGIAIVAALAGVIGSIVSLGYYGSVLRVLFAPAPAAAPLHFDAEDAAEAPAKAGSARVAVGLLALAVALLGAVPLVGGVDALIRLFA
jgi:NADH-quinone oxidoreductase subunit N